MSGSYSKVMISVENLTKNDVKRPKIIAFFVFKANYLEPEAKLPHRRGFYNNPLLKLNRNFFPESDDRMRRRQTRARKQRRFLRLNQKTKNDSSFLFLVTEKYILIISKPNLA